MAARFGDLLCSSLYLLHRRASVSGVRDAISSSIGLVTLQPLESVQDESRSTNRSCFASDTGREDGVAFWWLLKMSSKSIC